MGLFTSPEHHLWVSSGLRGEPPQENDGEDQQPDGSPVRFHPELVDLVRPLPPRLGQVIAETELHHIAAFRPSADPHVEAFFEAYLDGSAPSCDPVLLNARSWAGLQALVEERPEVCPLLRSELSRFSLAVKDWLLSWPREEPSRQGLPRVGKQSTPSKTAEDLEFELHGVLDLFRSYGWPEQDPQEVPGGLEAVNTFFQVAIGWIFKLASLYGLDLEHQPERMWEKVVQAEYDDRRFAELGDRLSLLAWTNKSQVADLVGCPFFRPQEELIRDFVSAWTQSQQEAQQRWHHAQALQAESSLEAPASGEVEEESPPTEETWNLFSCLCRELLDPTENAPEETPLDATFGHEPAYSSELEATAKLSQNKGQQAPTIVKGSSFTKMNRHKGNQDLASTKASSTEEDTGALQVVIGSSAASASSSSSSFRAWNSAEEVDIVGHERQVVVSEIPMRPEGIFRLDLRVLSGVEAEAAHLCEMGLCSEPALGVHFGPGQAGAGRPPLEGERQGGEPFFRFCSVPDILLEGVRLSIQVDFDKGEINFRNIPQVEGYSVPNTPLRNWLKERRRMVILRQRPQGELECPLFKHQAEHLHEMIDAGTLSGDLARAVLADVGVSVARERLSVAAVESTEEYHFYIVIPAGIEVEVF